MIADRLNVIKCVFLIGILLCMGGCSHPPPKKMVPVKTTLVQQKDVLVTLPAIGQLHASREIDVHSQVSGTLESVFFQDGGWVEERAPLYRIDPRPFEADVKAAEAALREHQAQLVYAKEYAQAYGALVHDAYVSRLDYEKGMQNVAVLEAMLDLDAAHIDKAVLNLGYTLIQSPVSGYCGFNQQDAGNYIDVAAQQTLVTIRQVNPLKTLFSVHGSHLPTLRKLYAEHPIRYTLYLDDQRKQSLSGYIVNINNEIDPMTGMISIEGVSPNEEELGWPGQFIYVEIELSTLPHAWVIPKQAIVRSDQGTFIYIVENQTAHQLPVTIVYEEGENTVIDGGVTPSTHVVIDGMNFIQEGSLVVEST